MVSQFKENQTVAPKIQLRFFSEQDIYLFF